MPVVITGGAEVAVPGVWVWTQDHESGQLIQAVTKRSWESRDLDLGWWT